MGQTCPLPERIPKPTDQQLNIMINWGITFNDLDNEQNKLYVPYSLPDGWKIVDQRHRHDLPCSYIIDEKCMKRCVIDGAWKGTYDNYLNLRLYSYPYNPLYDNIDSVKQEEYQNLLLALRKTEESVAGCGNRAQLYIDNSYKNLENFVKANPTFKLPMKPICYDDGSQGVMTGISMGLCEKNTK
jgi:hypothetical protein